MMAMWTAMCADALMLAAPLCPAVFPRPQPALEQLPVQAVTSAVRTPGGASSDAAARAGLSAPLTVGSLAGVRWARTFGQWRDRDDSERRLSCRRPDEHADATVSAFDAVRLERNQIDDDSGHERCGAVDCGPYAADARIGARSSASAAFKATPGKSK